MACSKILQDGISLSSSTDDEFILGLCVICQKNEGKTSSTLAGRERVTRAADKRRDVVWRRLSRCEGNFCYHVSNSCYKSYTHTKSLASIVKSKKTVAQSAPDDATSNRRSSVGPRNRPVPQENIDMRKILCVVCGFSKKSDSYTKYRICECNRADRFLKAAVYLQNDVYTRTCDLMDINAVFGADLYYHKKCMDNFLYTYDRGDNMGDENGYRSLRHSIWTEIEVQLRPQIETGNGIPLTSIRDDFNTKLTSNGLKTVTNKQVKIQLVYAYGDGISFVPSKKMNESMMVIGKSITREELADVVRNQDVMLEAGKRIRTALKGMDYDLNDSFCDGNDMKRSWTNSEVPEDVIKFLSGLFNFNAASYTKSLHTLMRQTDLEDENDDDDDEATTTKSRDLSIERCRQLQAIIQVLFYTVNNGRRRTPLHIMIAETVHQISKSEILIRVLNRFGLSISIDELRRYHSDLANYTVESCKNGIPIPSHFDTDVFTVGGMDNFDHEEATPSGIGGSHDAVMILVQAEKESDKKKPNISSTNITHGDNNRNLLLPCQILKPFYKPGIKPKLGDDLLVEKDLYECDDVEKKEIKRKDVLWALSRMGRDENNAISWENPTQTMPSWSGTNSVWTYEQLGESIVGFLPVIPHPITEYSTVYTAMKNYQTVLSQLKQDMIPIFCDEGVYHIAREIKMMRPDEFSDTVILLGSFHMIKVVLSCIGKYLKGSGAESIWIESKCFGINVVESVLNGKNYSRSVKGILQLAEAMTRLQLMDFFISRGNDSDYNELLRLTEETAELVSSMQRDESRHCYESDEIKAFLSEFEQYIEEKSKSNENFKYWNIFLELSALLRNLIRGDREGNWCLHLDTVQAMLPFFAFFDCTNYFRWSSLYIEDMRNLPTTAPGIHEYFMHGGFVVKRTPGHFKAIGVDMCLEQTINKSQKSAGGIIGATKRKRFVAEWELIYHEMLTVSNILREIGGIRDNYDLVLNHEFSESGTRNGERNVESMIDFILQHGSPFAASTEKKLQNIITKEIMPETISCQLLDVMTIGRDKYLNFRETRFTKRAESLFDRIHRTNLLTFKNGRQQQATKRKFDGSKVQSKKELTHAKRILEVARARGCDMDFLLHYDIVQSSLLFDSAGLMTKSNKSELVHELEKCLSQTDYKLPKDWEQMSTSVMVDVMANMRKVTTRNLTNFGELVAAFFSMTTKVVQGQARIDFVFDSYFEHSIKESERARRQSGVVIDISTIDNARALPADFKTFYPSSSNKLKLQQLIKDSIHAANLSSEVQVVMSQIIGSSDCSKPSLNNDRIEEADFRLILHIKDAAIEGTQRVLVLSPDTDVIVMLLYHWRVLKNHGLQELWIRAGVKDTTRYIPIHVLAERLGRECCNTLPAIHTLTGCDYTSKFGTKLSAVKAPIKYIREFGIQHGNEMETVLSNAEQFLVHVLKTGSTCTTIDQLRSFMHHHRKGITLADLPPSTKSVRFHILRAFFVTNQMISVLNADSSDLDPLDYGFEMCEDLLVPVQGMNLLQERYGTSCNCAKCATVRCPCRHLSIPCTKYCNCVNVVDNCKNPVTA